MANGLAMQRQSNGDIRHRMVRMKFALQAIPVEVLALAFIEFVFVSTCAAVLWYVFGHK